MKIYWIGKVQSRCLSAPLIPGRILHSSLKEEYGHLKRDRCYYPWVAAPWNGSEVDLGCGLDCSKNWLCWLQYADTWHSWYLCCSKSSSRVWWSICSVQAPPFHRGSLPATVWDASTELFIYIFILHILQPNLELTRQNKHKYPQNGCLRFWELAGGWAEALRHLGRWGLWVLVF